MRLTADKPRAIDRVRLALHDGGNQLGIFGRLVFQVGILNENDLAAGDRETGTQGRAFNLIFFIQNQAIDQRRELAFEQRARGIGRGVVDHDDLEVSTGPARIARSTSPSVALSL